MSNINLRPLLITDSVKARAKQIQQHAFLRRESLSSLLNRLGTGALDPGNDEQLRMQIDHGYKVVYSIEQQPAPLGWCQHISISVESPRMTPNPAAVVEILALWDITAKTPNAGGVLREARSIWTEKLADYRLAVNLLYPYVFDSNPAPA